VMLIRTLASQGAHAFATRNNVTTVSPSALVSERATKDWNMWKWRLDQEPEGVFQDTVGALVLDSSGGLGAGVSRSAHAAFIAPFRS
jgi:taspase, threonine aspartase, 1